MASKKVIPQNQGRKYYLWVTGSDYYNDEEGRERAWLDPEYDSEDKEEECNWSCHRATKPGDLIMMYRTKISDIPTFWTKLT